MTEPNSRHPFATLKYALAFGVGAEPVDVRAWNSVVLARAIPGATRQDAIGCYPLAPLAADSDLSAGLTQLKRHGLVSMVLVTDPLRTPPIEALKAAFDFCRPFKTHYAFDRRIGNIDMSRRRWREVRIARAALGIAEVAYDEHIDRFAQLYANLVEQHGIEGVAAFDADFFNRLTDVPGIRAIAAFLDDVIVSFMLFVVDDEVAYAFLAGTSQEGRERCAHYGLYAEAIEHFTEVAVVNLGGAPGLSEDASHGIAYVKRKLTNTTLRSHICGAVLDEAAYASLSNASSSYFPAYRTPLNHAIGDTR